jgi:hypothetical protein
VSSLQPYRHEDIFFGPGESKPPRVAGLETVLKYAPANLMLSQLLCSSCSVPLSSLPQPQPLLCVQDSTSLACTGVQQRHVCAAFAVGYGIGVGTQSVSAHAFCCHQCERQLVSNSSSVSMP